MSDKTGQEGRGQQLTGLTISFHTETLTKALGPTKENNYTLESPNRIYSVGLLGAKTEIPDKKYLGLLAIPR